MYQTLNQGRGPQFGQMQGPPNNAIWNGQFPASQPQPPAQAQFSPQGQAALQNAKTNGPQVGGAQMNQMEGAGVNAEGIKAQQAAQGNTMKPQGVAQGGGMVGNVAADPIKAMEERIRGLEQLVARLNAQLAAGVSATGGMNNDLPTDPNKRYINGRERGAFDIYSHKKPDPRRINTSNGYYNPKQARAKKESQSIERMRQNASSQGGMPG